VRHLAIIGIGTGNPDHLTLQAVNALKSATVIFLTDKGDAAPELLQLRKDICERHLTPSSTCRIVEFRDPERDRAADHYLSAVEAWHQSRSALYEKLIQEHLAENERGAFLAWGDPSLYDSILRIMQALSQRGCVSFEYEVIPGVNSLQMLAARHRIPMNQIGEPVSITTGRRLAEGIASGKPPDGDVLVMLDGDCAFSRIADGETEIYWGAYLGMAGEMLVSGKVRDVAERIRQLRSEARAKRGWIMDTYLLRRKRAE
jgi:precorrin-6A synthase